MPVSHVWYFCTKCGSEWLTTHISNSPMGLPGVQTDNSLASCCWEQLEAGGGASTSSEVPEAAERQYCTQRNLSRSVLIVDSSEMTSDRYLPHPQPQRGAAPDASRCCRGHKGPTAKCNWEKLYLASSLAGHFLGDFNLLKSLWIPRIWEFHGECNTLQCCFPLEPSLMKNLQD